MGIPLPNLDDRTYADLVDEARALIPTYDSRWTNHNPSDPGITLIELFTWLAEMLIYRANRLPERHLTTFLRLLNGPDWKPGSDLAEDIRTTVVKLRQRDRAVTCEDYEALACSASPDVARAKCIPRRYLDAGTEAERTADQPGHVSLVIVPQTGPQPNSELIQAVDYSLEPRRILTTRHHVVGPIYAPVSAEILVARRADVRAEDLRPQIVATITNFLNPWGGGPDGDGWPFGRDVYVSELYELLEGMPGVDYVPDITLTSQCPAGMLRCVGASELWHESGDLIGLGLAAHHLPQAQIDPARVVISAVFIPVQMTIQVTPKAGVVPAVVRRVVKTAVERFFHPLYGGPDGTAARQISAAAIKSLVRGLSEIQAVVSIDLHSDPTHEVLDEEGNVTDVRIKEQELVDVQVTVELTD